MIVSPKGCLIHDPIAAICKQQRGTGSRIGPLEALLQQHLVALSCRHEEPIHVPIGEPRPFVDRAAVTG
jgi:hypothetical protein